LVFFVVAIMNRFKDLWKNTSDLVVWTSFCFSAYNVYEGGRIIPQLFQESRHLEHTERALTIKNP